MHGVSSLVGRPTNLGRTAADHPHIQHVTPQMTLRYVTLASSTPRAAYDEALGKMRRQFTLTPVGKHVLPDKVGWLHANLSFALAREEMREQVMGFLKEFN